MKKYDVGYTQGTFDLFHVGHLNLLENAKKLCNVLIVGINDDELVLNYKNKKPIISVNDRRRIIKALSVVDEVVIANTLNKVDALKKYNFDVLFIGDDWKNNERWIETEKQLKAYGVPVVFLPHTTGISSTMIRAELNGKKDENNE